MDSGELSLQKAAELAALEDDQVLYHHVRNARQHRKQGRSLAPSTLGREEMRSVARESAATSVGAANSGGGAAAAEETQLPPAPKVMRVYVPVLQNGKIFPGQLLPRR